MSITVTEKRINNTNSKGNMLIKVNIKYPQFESEKHKKLCQRMNLFYSSVAKKLSHRANAVLAKKINRQIQQGKPCATVSMSYKIALCGKKVISVVIDLGFDDGRKVKTRRFSQMWSTKNENILPASEVIKHDRASKKRIFSLVLNGADQNADNPSFGYFSNYKKSLAKHFDFSNCFAVPKGICFFINAGILSPAKYGVSSFVLSFGNLEGLIKGDYREENVEREPKRADIVNNV